MKPQAAGQKDKHSCLPEGLPQVLANALRRYLLAERGWSLLGGACAAILASGAITACACLFDRLIDVAGRWRAPLPWLAAAALAFFIIKALRHVLRKPDFDRLANILDSAVNDGRGHLRSTLDFTGKDGMHPFFTGETGRQAEDIWRDKKIPVPPQRKAGCRLAAYAAGLVILVAGASQIEALRAGLLWQRFIDPMGNYMRPTSTWIELANPLPKAINSGDDLEIKAVLRGKDIQGGTPTVQISQADGSVLLRYLEAKPDKSFALTLANLHQDLACVLAMGAARSESHAVRVQPRPSITGIMVEYEYPAYAKMKNIKEELKGRTITALEGTKLRITLKANIGLKQVSARSGEESVAFRINAKNPLEATRYHLVGANERLELKLLSAEGLESKNEQPLLLRAIPDAPPSVNITSRLNNCAFFEGDSIPLAFRAQDDIGLSEISVTAPGGIDIPVEFEPFGAKECEKVINLPVSSLLTDKAESINIRLQARDTKGQASSSQTLKINIAVNSFDRQIAQTLQAFTGNPNSHEADRGQDSLKLAAERLVMLKSVESRASLAIEAMNANKNAQDELNQIKTAMTGLDNFSGYLFRNEWHRDFSSAAVLPRLREHSLQAAVLQLLAPNPTMLREKLEAVAAAQDKKAALTEFRALAAESIQRQEKGLEGIKARYHALQRELAGYFAANLGLSLADAKANGKMDDELLATARAQMTTIANFLKGGADKEALPEAESALAAILSDADAKTALGNAAPLMQKIAAALAPIAAKAAAAPDDATLAYAATAKRMHQNSANFDILASLLSLSSSQPERDQLGSFNMLLRYLADTGNPKPGQSMAIDPAAFFASEQDCRLYRLLNAIQGLRSHAEALRLTLTIDNLAPGRPEFQEHWIAMRECYLELRALTQLPQPGKAGEVLPQLLPALAALENWSVKAEDNQAVLIQTMRDWENRCASLATALQPDTKAMFDRLAANLQAKRGEILAGIKGYRLAIAEEIDRLEKTRNIYARLNQMEMRIRVLQTALLRAYDIDEACRLHQSAPPSPNEGYAALCLLAGRVADLYLKDFTNAYVPQQFKEGIGSTIHNGRVISLKSLDAIAANMEKLCAPEATPESINAVLQAESSAHLLAGEKKLCAMALQAEAALAKPKEAVTAILGDRTRAASAWAVAYCQLQQLTATLKNKRPQAEIKPQAQALARALSCLEKLPKELEAMPLTVAECAGDANLTEERRTAIADELSRADEEMKTLARGSGAAKAAFASLAASRAAASAAMGLDNSGKSALRWNLMLMESMRRWQGFGKRQASTGGMALAGDGLDNLKLPKHLYLELQRARGGSMPELFRELCYQYLNAVLERAK